MLDTHVYGPLYLIGRPVRGFPSIGLEPTTPTVRHGSATP